MSENRICECCSAPNVRHVFGRWIIDVQEYFGLALPLKGYSRLQEVALLNVYLNI